MKTRCFSKHLVIFVLLFTAGWSCTQDEGIGGNSHIKGVLTERFYNEDFSIFQYEQAAKDEDVFLLFGDESTIGENTSTSFNGNFEFKYLWPGNYTLYYYSEDSTLTSTEKQEMLYVLELGKNETLQLDELVCYNTLKWNEGRASIHGKVTLINYRNESSYPNLEIKDVTPAQEQDVYISYNNADSYTDRIRTESDGSFHFNNLLKGSYKISVYSEDVTTGSTAKILQQAEVEITEREQSVSLEQFIIEKI